MTGDAKTAADDAEEQVLAVANTSAEDPETKVANIIATSAGDTEEKVRTVVHTFGDDEEPVDPADGRDQPPDLPGDKVVSITATFGRDTGEKVGNVSQTFGSWDTFTDDEAEDAGSLVVRQATAADWESLERARRRRLPVDVIASIAATNGGDWHDD